MTSPLRIDVLTEGLAATYEVALPCEFGRQRASEPKPPSLVATGGEAGRARIVIAPTSLQTVARVQFVAVAAEGAAVNIVNLSNRIPVRLRQRGDEFSLQPNKSQPTPPSRILIPPFEVACGRVTVRFGDPDDEPEDILWSLAVPATAPRSDASLGGSLLDRLTDVPSHETHVYGQWLRDVVDVLHGTLASEAFVADATRAVVERLPFTAAETLVRQADGRWRTVARHPPQRGEIEPRPFSTRVLNEMVLRRATTGKGELDGSHAGSLSGLDLALAAPILDADEIVVGALAAMRPAAEGPRRADELDALLLQLLAGCIGVGWARQRQRQEVEEHKARFERFFTSELAEELAKNPSILHVGRERTVTLLFADIRRFSAISARLGPRQTFEWINAVMSALTECVQDEGGVLLNYLGDALFAMWNAPQDQPDHAARAVRAALAMLARAHAERDDWKALAGEETIIGLGVNTGLARIGNTGSQTKFQYGALGDAVNIASRLEALTKHLGRPLLISAATHAALPPDAFFRRRVIKARLENIPNPVDVFAVEANLRPADEQFFQEAERALAELENGNFVGAISIAGPLLKDPPDGPLKLLITRASAALANNGLNFDPAWEPPRK